MSTTTLEFTLRKNGALTDPDGNTVLLSDPTAAFGVRRADTGGVVVADATAMTRVSAGVYTYPVTDPAAGLTYQWYAEYAAGGVTRRDPFTTLGTAGASAAGFWWTQAGLTAQRGDVNTAAASSLSGVAGPDTATIQAVSDRLDSDADRALRVRGYGRPEDRDASEDYPVVSGIVTDVLWVRLEMRRTDLDAPKRGELKRQEDELWEALDDMLTGPMSYHGQTVDFPRLTALPANAPVAVYPTVDRDGRTVPAGNTGYGPRWDPAAGIWRGW